MYRSVLENKDFIRWSHEAIVLFVAHNELGHEEKKETGPDGKEVKRCTLYPGLACDDHVGAAVDIDNARGDGMVKVPFLELCPNTWLVLPTGEVKQVSEEDQFVASKTREQVEKAQKDLGASLPAKRFAELQASVVAADEAIDKDLHREALTHLAALGKAVPKPHAALRDLVAERLATVEKHVTWAFEEVRDDEKATAAEKRERVGKLLATVDVEVLGARPDCHGVLKAWLDAPK